MTYKGSRAGSGKSKSSRRQGGPQQGISLRFGPLRTAQVRSRNCLDFCCLMYPGAAGHYVVRRAMLPEHWCCHGSGGVVALLDRHRARARETQRGISMMRGNSSCALPFSRIAQVTRSRCAYAPARAHTWRGKLPPGPGRRIDEANEGRCVRSSGCQKKSHFKAVEFSLSASNLIGI